jgi:peptidyl-tRNA hydrolase, PTH1 family
VKYLIVGLGNPGLEYENTRHNIGFMALDALADASNAVFSDKRYGFRTEIKHKSRKLVLVKPTTFMNLSGNAVRYWLNKEKLDTDRLIVILDDIALEFGKIRIRKKGGDSGHNGLSHIIDVLGTNQFPRMRLGIGNDFPPGRQTDYVLGNMTSEEIKTFEAKKNTYIEAILAFTILGIDRTMNFYNNK